MKILRNVYATAGLPNKSFKYIECRLPAYFKNKRYLTYDSCTNHAWFSFTALYCPTKVPNNTSLQDLIKST